VVATPLAVLCQACVAALKNRIGKSLSMFRNILAPGAILIACAVAAASFFIWRIYHQQFVSNWNPDQAYAGDVPAQRHLASCYMTGCPRVAHDPAFACAWRKIIAAEVKRLSPDDIKATRSACGRLSIADQKWVPRLDADIRVQMVRHEDRATQS
jgi:hypothetical protein